MNISSILNPFSSSPYRMNSARNPAEETTTTTGAGAELVTSDGKTLPLVSATLNADAGGGLARVVLEQTFENNHSETIRVTYKMPLPADGAVSGYEFTIGQRVVKGKVEPKQAAREKFERALAAGHTAAILEQEKADIFTQEIGNIPPGETIIARITVDQKLAWLPEGEWEFRFPTVIGPRYIGTTDTIEDARAVAVNVVKKKEDVRARLHLEMVVRDELVDGRNVSSPSHKLNAASIVTGPNLHQDLRHATLSALEGARFDRDIVVRWPVARPDVGVSLAVARPSSKEAHAHMAYGLVTVVPPAPEARFATMPRDLIVLVDTSGSMGGGPLDQGKKIVSLLIDSLEAQDRIELIEFSSRPHAWKKSPVNATPDQKKSAKAWVNKLSAGGATEMYSAIVEGLKALREGAQRQVVLVTDGYIGGEQQIVELLHERLPQDCRMHVVGVGSAVNRGLATALSRAGRGAEVLVGLDEDAERGARRLLDRTSHPVLTNVSIEGDAVVEVAPEHVPDVFAGSPIVAAVKLSSEGGTLTVRGDLANGKRWTQKLHVPAMRQGEGNQAIPALFAREHVADLEMRWTIGREAEMINRTIERVGTVFQIATRMTSWVAVDEVRTVNPGSGSRRVTQPQELPYGTTMESFGLAAGAMDGLVMDEEDLDELRTMVPMQMPMSQSQSAPFDMGSLGGAPPPPAPGRGAPPPSPAALRARAVASKFAKEEEGSSKALAPMAISRPAPAPAQPQYGGQSTPQQAGSYLQQPPTKSRRPRFFALFFFVLFFLIAFLGTLAYLIFR